MKKNLPLPGSHPRSGSRQKQKFNSEISITRFESSFNKSAAPLQPETLQKFSTSVEKNLLRYELAWLDCELAAADLAGDPDAWLEAYESWLETFFKLAEVGRV